MSPQPYRLGGGDESEFNLLDPQHDHHVPVNVPMRIMRKPVANFESTADTFPMNDIKRPPAVVETARPHRSRWTETLSRWTWEICSITLAAAALVAIIIILRVYDGESLHKWKVGISVNTVIAILSTIFKGLLAMPISTGLSQLKWISFSRTAQRAVNLEIYDGASRGAWGSFLLLVKQFSGRRLPAVANLGALIALIILVVDPFSQASASIGFCDRVSPSQAVLRRHNNYTWYQHDGAAQGELSTTMQFAILKGFYAPPMNSSQSMASFVQCPTGNCTFPTQENVSFSTLTMCHSCKDISSSIVRYDTGTKFAPRGYALDGYPYNLTLPGQGAELSSSIFNITSSDGFPGGHAKEQYPEDSWNRTNLFDFQGMAVVSSNSSCKYPSNCKFEPFAFDCSFRPCIKTFSANVTNGIYTEEERSREYLHYIDAPWYYFQKAVNRTFINGTWMDCTSQKTPSGTHTAQVILPEVQYLDPSSLSSLDALPSVWYQPECVYYIGQGSTLSLSEYMAHQIIKDELFKFSFIEIYDPGVVKGVAWMKELWNGGNMSIASVDSFVDKIALSIGAEMRGNGDEAYYEYQGGNISERLTRAWGDVHHTEPCIRAYWKYLSFLAVLFATELVFFISVIAIDYRSTLWQEGWKTSTLPLLVPGLHAHNMTDELRSLGGYSEIGEDHVKLVKTDGDWKLIKSPAG